MAKRADQLAGVGLARARPWDVTGAAFGAPIVVLGFFSWFGQVGDTGGVPGYFSGTGAAGIGLALAATALALHQILSGRAHDAAAPPLSALLAAAATLVILGGLIAKPDSVTLHVGSVAGFMTALTQTVVLTVGWVKGSGKSVRAANLRALQAEQEAADLLAAQRAVQPPPQQWRPAWQPPPVGYAPPGGYPPPFSTPQPPPGQPTPQWWGSPPPR